MAAGKEIKRLRESGIKKISAETLAGYMNVDAAKLRKWEQRDADPKDSGDKKNVETYFGCTLIGLEKLDKFQFYDTKFRNFQSIFLSRRTIHLHPPVTVPATCSPIFFIQIFCAYPSCLMVYFRSLMSAAWNIQLAILMKHQK